MTVADEKGSVEIKYRDYTLLAPLKDVQEAIALLKDDRIQNVDFMRSVNLALELVCATTHPKPPRIPSKGMENFCHDMVLWFANEVIHGRASIAIQSTTTH